MIKQIALPSMAHMQDVIEVIERKTVAEKMHPRETRGGKKPKPDLATEMAHAKTRLSQAEAELSASIADGYDIIAQYPFATGEGINLVLYKVDPK